MRARPVSVALIASLFVFGFGCVGFMEDLDYSGQEAVDRMGGAAGSPLPAGARDARVVETTGPDWLLNGEAQVPRAQADRWFDGLTLPCDQPTQDGGIGRRPTPILDPESWKAPYDGTWRTKTCEGSTFSGPHFEVSVTTAGDPAWVYVEAMTR